MITEKVKLRNSKPFLTLNQLGNQFSYLELRSIAALYAKKTRIENVSEENFDLFYNEVIIPRLQAGKKQEVTLLPARTSSSPSEEAYVLKEV